MPSELAPIALFAYNRPDHLAQTLGALERCPEAQDSVVTIFCDGPRSTGEAAAVRQVSEVAREWAASGTVREVVIQTHPTNKGLAASLISGISSVLETSDSVIILEDDLMVSPNFLTFMNEALRLYRDDSDVISIHGFTVDVDIPLPQSFFLRGADCWGWATWRRGWQQFESNGQALLDGLDASGLVHDFDFNGAYPYRAMLEDQVKGRIDSWAIRWYAAAFLANKLTLYPGRSLVENIGLDGSGTHLGIHSALVNVPGEFRPPLSRIPVVESPLAKSAYERAFARDRVRWKPLRSLFSRLS